MPRTAASGSRVEVSGETLLALVSVCAEEGPKGQELLLRHGLTEVGPGRWFPLKACLAALQELGEDLQYRVGRRIPDHARFPPGIDSVERALRGLGAAYQVNHRGGPIGYYRVHFKGPRQAEVECQNPYPSAFDQGLIEAIIDHFGLPPAPFEVALNPSRPTRRSGGESCTFSITW